MNYVPKDENIASQANVFRKKVRSIMYDNLQERYVTHQKRGKLDFKRLHKLPISDRLFKTKGARLKSKYSVSILADFSGSMFEETSKRRDDCNLFQTSTYKLYECIRILISQFDELGIETEIYAFGATSGAHIKEFGKEIDNLQLNQLMLNIDDVRYWLLDDCNNYSDASPATKLKVLSDFGLQGEPAEFLDPKSDIFSNLKPGIAGIYASTNLTAPLQKIINKKIPHEKGSHIIMCITDGKIDDEESTIDAIKKLQKQGSIVTAIGIDNFDIFDWCPKFGGIAITELKHLLPATYRIFNRFIKRV